MMLRITVPIATLESTRPRQSILGTDGSREVGTASAIRIATTAATRDHKQEDASPPEASEEPPADDRTGRNPDTSGRAPQSDRLRTFAPFGENVRDQRQRRWKDPGGADPHDRASGDQLLGRARERPCQAPGGENAQAGKEHALSPEAVAEAPGGKDQGGEHEAVGVDDPLQVRRGRPELADERGKRHVHDRDVDVDDQSRRA
jgi:hypothetical protein